MLCGETENVCAEAFRQNAINESLQVHDTLCISALADVERRAFKLCLPAHPEHQDVEMNTDEV